MNIEVQIAVNQFGQGVRIIDNLLDYFSKLTEVERRLHLHHLSYLLWQSKPLDSDIDRSIIDSSLKPSFTPCVLLRTHRLKIGIPKIINLPADELSKSYILLLYLFKQAYYRRFVAKKELSEKWWYSDLSNQANVQSIFREKLKKCLKKQWKALKKIYFLKNMGSLCLYSHFLVAKDCIWMDFWSNSMELVP